MTTQAECIQAALADLINLVRIFPGGRVSEYRLGMAAGQARCLAMMFGVDPFRAGDLHDATDAILAYAAEEAAADRLYVGTMRVGQVARCRARVKSALAERVPL